MNPWQMAQQLKHKLAAAVWSSGAADEVFGARGVHIFSGTPTEEQIPAGFPWCMVGFGSGDADPENPEFLTQTYNILTAAEVSGDPLGEQALIGGATANPGKSVGRGVAEIAERVRATVGDLVGSDGAKILVSSVSTGSPTLIGTGRHIVLDELTVSALCTSALHYAAPQQIKRASTTWTWEGAHCSGRFDFKQYHFGYANSAAPASPDDFDVDVYTGTAATTTHTVVGSKFYGVFAEYSSRKHSSGSFQVEGTSEAEVGSLLAS